MGRSGSGDEEGEGEGEKEVKLIIYNQDSSYTCISSSIILEHF